MSDCLLVHAPKFQNYYPALGSYTSLQWMALGIFALADSVEKAGFSARILHLGLEKNLDSNFTLAGYLTRHPSKVAAFSVHFHQQLYDTIRAVKAVKAHDPSIFVVLGGFTASFFAKDLLNEVPEIDGVVCGEGERSLPALVCARIGAEKDLSSIPNFMWRKNGVPTMNLARYTATAEDLADLDFENFEVMEHYEHYVRMPKIFLRVRAPEKLRWKLSKVISRKKRNIYFALSVGRGCTTNCVYCGGGIHAHKTISGRTRSIFRPQEKVLAAMRRLKDYGYHGAYISYDPKPHADDYYQTLFRRMRQEEIAFDLTFSAWGLPSKSFIEEFGRTFSACSSISISPEVGHEPLRKQTKGLYYTNQELLETLAHAERCNVRTTVYFSLGMPGETKENFEETVALKRKISETFTLAHVEAFSVEMEPASPWYLNPQKYNIELFRKELKDFLTEQADPRYSLMRSLGYWQKEYLGQKISGPEHYVRTVERAQRRLFDEHRAAQAILAAGWKAAGMFGLIETEDPRL